MNEKDLNIKYIREKTGLVENDELIPIILEMIQESYKAGLCQEEYDNTMGLIEENQQLKEQLEASEKARLKCLNKIKTLGKFDGENFTRSFTLWSADFNELAKILDIDKGE